MKLLLCIVGLSLLIGLEILRVYFIMPFPGSQEAETLQIAYFLNQFINYFRFIGIALIGVPVYFAFKDGTQTVKIIVAIVIAFYGVIFYSSNFRFLADKIFVQSENISFSKLMGNRVSETQLVLGVSIHDQSKAYPIEVIGYHHQVRDTISGQPIMVTYCTVCRTGRVYSPMVNGELEEFRLVGMDHYNAMFEDKSTGSWWRQANGEAVAGPLAGSVLATIPSEQMTLAAWINLHPETLILQPDTLFNDAYKGLEKYDEGKMKGRLEGKDSLSWKDKSWVVGVQIGLQARAYDWIDLQKFRLLEDTLDSMPLLIAIAPDSASFYVFKRIVKEDTLSFSISLDGKNIQDNKTKSSWSWNGRCVDGALKGSTLQTIQSYQEYWHSWKMFRGNRAYQGVRN